MAGFEYKVVNYIDAGRMKADLQYTTNDLTDAMMRQASLFAYYGVQAALASRQVDQIKMLLETAEAAVYRELADKTVTKGNKVVVASIDKDVAVDARVLKLKKALNEAKQIEKTANIAVEAFRHRKDMLVQQGFLSREEMRGEVSIAMKNAKEEEFAAAKERNLEAARRRAEMNQGN